MNRKIRVAVTGIGSTIGLGIAKALRMSNLSTHIIGLDSNPLSVGLYSLDSSFVLPSATQSFDVYYNELVEVCRTHKVDILFSGWDGELIPLGQRDFENDTRGTVLAFNSVGVEAALDKWLTFRGLSEAGIPTPETALASNADAVARLKEKHEAPYIMKPRRGAGSRGLHRVKSKNEISFFSSYLEDPVVQEELLPADEEYTVGVFIGFQGEPCGSLALKRSLMSGLSYRMEVVENNEINQIAVAAVKAMGIQGAANVQLRLTSGGPKVFEINPRFSSSSCVRAYFGFNEAEMAIRLFLFKQQPYMGKINYGMCLRYWEEMYLPVSRMGAQPSPGTQGFSCGIVQDWSQLTPIRKAVSG